MKAALTKYYYLIFALLFIQGACSKEHLNSAKLTNTNEIFERLDCDDAPIKWNDQSYKIGELLGRGVTGKVFALVSEKGPSDSIVAKIIQAFDPVTAKSAAFEELQLSGELDNFFVSTSLAGLYRSTTSRKKELFSASLIKDRVHGMTLHNFVGSDLFKSNPKKYLQSFLVFKARFSKSLELLAQEKNIYVWDIHASNIMYDIRKNTWILVDANREQGIEQLESKLRHLFKSNLQSRSLFKLLQLFQNRELRHDQHFFQKVIDIYWKEYEMQMRGISEKRISPDEVFEEISL